MPATFATFPADLIATLAERYAIAAHGRTEWRAHTRQPQRQRRRRDSAAADRQPPEGHKRGGKLAAQAESHGDGDNDTQ